MSEYQANPQPRPALAGDEDFDVAIVGGGYTGLWTAYYLASLAPHLKVAVLEAHVCGFGASGRNGGWLMGALEGSGRLLSKIEGERKTVARGFVTGIVGEVGKILAELGIDCDFQHGGGIYAAARYAEQLDTQRCELKSLRAQGYGEQDYRWMDSGELRQHLNIREPLGAIFTPHVARIHPAKMVRGLAAAVESLGVEIFEQTRVLSLADGALLTANGCIRAKTRVLAMEGFSYELLQQRRQVLPIQSMIVATAPLPQSLWDDIGLNNREVFCDATPLISYGQRSADNRMVFGSRGSYLFGGRPRSDFQSASKNFAAIERLLVDCFPQLKDTPITHRWGGTLGLSRSFHPHAVLDSSTGLATAGGYVGEGVGGSNLMARTLVDMILENNSELAGMPWAYRGTPDSVLRRWEPEPLRWLGFKATSLALRLEEVMCNNAGALWKRKMAKSLSAIVDPRNY